MATLAQVSRPSAADFYDQYGPLAAPLREALGFGGQNDVDMLDPSRVSALNGENGGGQMLTPSPALQRMIDQGLVTYGSNGLGGEQEGMGYTVNWDKMPHTAFGSPAAVGISGYDPSMHDILYNSHAVSKDPNFGYITPTANVDTQLHGLDSVIYNLAPSLAIMAMTLGAGIPALASQGLNATRFASQFGSGHGFDPMSLAGIAGSALGVPSWLTSGASTLANIARGGKPNPIGLVGGAINAVGGAGGP